MRALVVKFPIILNYDTDNLKSYVNTLRQMAQSRELWRENFDTITPSLLAFFIRDHSDLTMRLAFLLASGQGASWTLRDVFKVSNNHFERKHPAYYRWYVARKTRDRARAQRAAGASAAAAGGSAGFAAAAARATGGTADAPASGAAAGSGSARASRDGGDGSSSGAARTAPAAPRQQQEAPQYRQHQQRPRRHSGLNSGAQ